jgi:spore coat protein A
MGAEPPNPEVRIVTHVHGAHVPAAYDGWPLSWYTPGNSVLYNYPNHQEAATIWYHDHALGITRLNVYAGLAGFYLITDPAFENGLNLPGGAYDIGLALQDYRLNPNGSLYIEDEWVGEVFGDISVVNGKAWPYLDVQPRKYRFRLLDGSLNRYFNLKLLETDAQGNIFSPEVPGPAFWQIGTDQGYLRIPVQLNGPTNSNSPRLLMGPGERCDVVIDFAGYNGRYFVLQNNAKSPFKSLLQQEDVSPLPQIMLFRVSSEPVPDPSRVPNNLAQISPIPPGSSTTTRDIVMTEEMDMMHPERMMMMLNGAMFNDPITELPQLGTTEIWRFINTTVDDHPMHMHLVKFQIMDRRPFDVDLFLSTGQLRFTGPVLQPLKNERGWKDTFQVPPGYVGRVITRFENYTGNYVYHCHILPHEEHEMMRPFTVVGNPSPQAIRDEEIFNAAIGQLPQISALALLPNYPNPFNPVTTLSFSLPKAGKVNLSIWDVSGRLVATVVDGWREEGYHDVTFDGSNLASGVYFTHFQTETGSQVQKMVLMK